MPSKTGIQRADSGVWTLNELGDVWRRVHGSWLEPAFILAAFGSCRVGESLGPLASEVELRDVDGVPVALVSIARQMGNDGKVTENLKTKGSKRVVCVPGKAALRLAEIASSMPREWYLTHDGIGNPQPQHRLVRSWRDIGMEHPFRNLRNSWQTWMRWEVKVPPYYIEVLMGHAGKSVTGRYYDRPSPEQLLEVVSSGWADYIRSNKVSPLL